MVTEHTDLRAGKMSGHLVSGLLPFIVLMVYMGSTAGAQAAQGNACLSSADDVPAEFTHLVPQSGITASATTVYSDAYTPPMAVDGNCASFWHTASARQIELPQSITLNLGGEYVVTGLSYLPRQDGIANGHITAFNVYVSLDGTSFTRVAEGSWPDDSTRKYVTWKAVRARYVRLEATQAHFNVAAAADLNVAIAP